MDNQRLIILIPHICVCFILHVGVHPAIAYANTLQVLHVHRVTLQYHLSSGGYRNFVREVPLYGARKTGENVEATPTFISYNGINTGHNYSHELLEPRPPYYYSLNFYRFPEDFQISERFQRFQQPIFESSRGV